MKPNYVEHTLVHNVCEFCSARLNIDKTLVIWKSTRHHRRRRHHRRLQTPWPPKVPAYAVDKKQMLLVFWIKFSIVQFFFWIKFSIVQFLWTKFASLKQFGLTQF